MSDEKKPKRIKVVPRLFKIGEVYYYRVGDDERKLGAFKTDAQAIKAKEQHEIMRDSLGAKAFKFRAKQKFPEYLEYRCKQAAGEIEGRRKLSGGTIREIEYLWDKHLVRFFGNMHFAKIDDIAWEKYCDRATVADLKNHRKVLGGFLRWCKKRGLIKVLPEFEIPVVVPRKRPILTQDQIKALVTNAHGVALPFVAMYLFMGMRRGEQTHLKWSDIDFEHRSLIVRDETTRTRKGRTIPLNDFVAQVLLCRLREQQEKGLVTEWVFPRRGQPHRHMRYCGFNSAWHTTLKRAGLSGMIEPHDLRATYEHYANKRAEFTDMQREKMAGASIRVQSQRYVTFDADDVRGLENAVQFDGLSNALNHKLLHAPTEKRHGKKTGKRSNKSDVDNEKAN